MASMPDGELAEVEVGGTRAWALAVDVAGLKKTRPKPPARLVPGFDPFVIGARPRESLVDKRYASRVFRQAGWISPVVLVDGMAAGVWSHERRGDRLSVTVEPFGRLTARMKGEIGEEADRLGTFLGAPVELST
jgi:hypothetical protein